MLNIVTISGQLCNNDIFNKICDLHKKILRKDNWLRKISIENKVINTFINYPLEKGKLRLKNLTMKEFTKVMGVTGLNHSDNFKDIVERFCYMEKELKDEKDKNKEDSYRIKLKE